jgi:HEAT repeat protein
MPPRESDNGDFSDVPRESSRTILFQFVVFPLGIVVIAVAIFLLFGKLANDEQSIPDYLNEIRSGSSHERWQAAYQLSKALKRGEGKRVPNLEEQVAALYQSSKHDDPRIRRYLSMVLGSLGDRRATPLLVDGLKEPDVETRIYALLALADLRDPASVPRIIELTKDPEKDVRKTALYALGSIGDPRAATALAKALNDETPDVRFNAAVALSRFGDKRAIPALHEMLDRAHLNQIRDMREDQKEDAMIVAIGAYSRVAGADAKPELQALTHDPSIRVQAAAKEALRSKG